MDSVSGFLPSYGHYQELLSYQKAEVVYDVTFRFCERFLKRGDRTIDQMVQAARSGKQNIVEGSKASGTSKEMEIKLTNVARASLEELLMDYQDYLRVRDLRRWEKDSAEAQFVRRLGLRKPMTFELFREFCETRPAEVVANIAICLIELSMGSADSAAGSGFPQRRRHPRTNDARAIAASKRSGLREWRGSRGLIGLI